MIAVVTGGAGFIGSHLVDLLLERGYRVRIVDNFASGREANLAGHRNNGQLSVEDRDIRSLDPGDPAFSGADVVFHLAALADIVPSIDRPTEYVEVNVQGTVRVLEAARAAGARRLVYAASSSCYGLASTPTSEQHPVSPQYPYSLSKHLGEQCCFHWHQAYRLPLNSLRIFNAYGPRSRTTGAYGAVFGVFLRQKLASAPFTVVGDGTQSRDFVFVTDVAEAFMRAGETDLTGRVWNVGASQPQTVNRLVELLGGPVVHLPTRPGEPDCTWADTTAISRDLDWKPAVGFEDGVSRMLENIDMWSDAPLWDPSSIEKATTAWFRFLSPAGDLPTASRTGG